DGCGLAVDRGVAAGVVMMVLPCVDIESASEIAALHRARPDRVRTAAGLHPTETGEDWRAELEGICSILDQTNPVAIGETGIDLYWDDSNIDLQKEAFIAQLRLGAERELPVIIHSRDGLEVCLECIRKAGEAAGGKPLSTLIFHSFTGSPADVRRIREVCDPYFGINGVVTFKNSKELPAAVKEIGLDRLLLETDSPYLAPVPKRGRRNESSYLPLINDKIAEILSISPREAEEATDRNAKQVFKI
ncbi:MAG: TatD family hydrolase, partial [Muribaculaceae bacterium]|nr:TatD family hydrolase [Muribaculaceae bacterium]